MPNINRFPQEILLETELSDLSGSFIFFGSKMTRIREVIEQMANTDVIVLIQGESGVGKEIVALLCLGLGILLLAFFFVMKPEVKRPQIVWERIRLPIASVGRKE